MSMDSDLRAAYRGELAQADALESAGDWAGAFRHLERAHILGQRHTLAHTRTHLRMLRNGWKRADARELFGQVVRSVAALTKTVFWVPAGNTGGANVHPLKPMPIPDDLKPWLE
ncbi:DUF3703 domain-containing protein [Silanimonas sp.]|jgi:hypothetical protein|uniref:DUF3703 domain-containing protein n=1 Tax=Silanimonas sp. TaxID=1929290 RepID=UPI0022BE8261|nr:DUF3703 domain-containing protein [Silanimonas sp.]MCZ8166996.1 DUF3703 domain-containing protein [Silanimonas sp.]